MGSTTPIGGLPYPALTDPPNVPSDMAALATALDGQISPLFQRIDVAAPTAVINFSNIPQTCRHLQIIHYARGDTVAAAVDLGIQFNADSTAIYEWGRFHYSSATTPVLTSAGSNGVTGTSGFLGTIPAASASAGEWGQGETTVAGYSKNTKAPNWHGSGSRIGTVFSFWGGTYNLAVNVLSIQIFAQTGNIVAGSSFSLYGVP